MRDWDSNFDADEIDPTGGCGWDSEAQEWHDFDPDC